MNILFHTDVEPVPENGGIERVTSLLAHALCQKGHIVGACYQIPVDREAPRGDFHFLEKIPKRNPGYLAAMIKEKNIDCIVVQKMFRDLPWVRKAVEMSGLNTKIIFCLHTAPSPIHGLSGFKALVLNDTSKRNYIKIPLKILLHPLRRRQYDRQLFDWPAKYADHIVLLSDSYIRPWLRLSQNSAPDAISAIPNPLSFNPHTSTQDIAQKKKKVLIVARMAENQKNIREALRIWKKIMSHEDMSGWTLDIVGDGPHRLLLEKEAARLDVKNVNFHGYRDPRPFLKESSIFMMTSRWEGWPMTINEAMQYGCVPVVYASFSAIYDVITDGSDGILAEPFHTDLFAGRLRHLMQNKEQRIKMALAGVKSSARYNLDSVALQWENLFSSVMNSD